MKDFSDLVLLIGTNPLPNYVVAEYFLKTNQALRNIWLVYSEEVARQVGTRTQAEHLDGVLRTRHSRNRNVPFPLQKVALSNVSNAQMILRDTKEKLIGKLPGHSSVHLNYTGGTKAMGTHVYRALEQDTTKDLTQSFSYLDGRNFQIVDDKNGIINKRDLRDEVSISFIELITLHGFKRKNDTDSKDFSAAVNVLKGLIDEGRLDEYYSKNGGYNRTCIASNRNYVAKEPFLSVLKAMPEDYRLLDAQGCFVVPSDKKQFKRVFKFLDGVWLEDYVHAILHDVLSASKITVLKDWIVDKEGWETDFQIDVILLKGYQLIGISCTTADEKHLCKNKGFEIILRTRQIGGDEAKAMLVTLANDSLKKKLQEELQLNTGITSGNIVVLGKDDLKEDFLIQKITDFIHQEV